jgi:toxin secretion/phage lysis holin
MIAITSLPLTIVTEGTKYLFQDWEFAKWIAVAIAIDTILGVWKHLIHKDASSESFFSRFTRKIVIYIFLMILSNFASHATVGGTVVGPMQWIGTYLCVFMMVREIFSIIENIQAIYPILPKNFVKRMKDFNDSGEYISGKPIRFSDKDAREEV